jgi:hypothetical protein
MMDVTPRIQDYRREWDSGGAMALTITINKIAPEWVRHIQTPSSR